MPAIPGFLAGLIYLCVLALSPLSAWAQERIHDYQVDIQVRQDGTLKVIEDIRITAQGDQILHGITREIPLTFIAMDGHLARSMLTMIDVTRDEAPESHETIGSSRGETIRIGHADVTLVPGEYRYRIHYNIDRIIRHSGDHDRLTWNINGIKGKFPIDALSVRLTLPEGITPLSARVHTGRLGEDTGHAAIHTSGNTVRFIATQPYATDENMTIALQLPKGSIHPPDGAQLREWWYRDHGSALYGAIIAAGSMIMGFVLWFLFGRDPRPGIIVPRWDPPDGMSPGQVNYLVSWNFEDGFWKAFSASILALAIKGHLAIENIKDGMTLRRVSDVADSSLPAGQAAIMRQLPAMGDTRRFDTSNAAQTLALGEAFGNAVKSEIGQRFYQPRKWVWLSFSAVLFAVWLTYDGTHAIGGEYLDDLPLPLHFFCAIFSWFFVFHAVKTWRKFLHRHRRPRARDRVKIIASLCCAAASVWLFAQILWADAPTLRDSFLLAFSLSVVSTLLWAFVGRMSPQGRALMDGIAGLVRYLELAEKDRLALTASPAMSPTHYEALLPYAVALGLEQAWSNHFDRALAAAKASGEDWHYHPAWYVGSNAGNLGQVADVSTFLSGLADSIQATLPSEASSDESGSSGSGRGGGGIGGW